MTKEELKELLMQKDVDVKTLAQIAKLLNSGEVGELLKQKEEKTTTSSNALKPEIGFKIEANYPDFTITKTTARTVKQLVVMVSQDSYFIRLLNNEDNPIEVLTDDNYADFTSGMEEQTIEDFWTPVIRSGKKFYNPMMEFIKNYKEFIKMGICKYASFKFKPDEGYGNSSADLRGLKDNLRQFPVIKPLIREYYDKQAGLRMLTYCPCSLYDLIETFGLNNVRDFMDELELTVYNLDSIQDPEGSYYYREYKRENSIRHKSVLDYNQFKEYCLYSGIRFGYRTSFREFIRTWKDDLNMQEKVYGYVKEKYPKNLQTHHDQMSDKYELRREQINEELFEKQVKDTDRLTWTMKDGDYTFLAPQTKEDFIEEAHQQANCLASYINKFTEGRCNILFMRNKETPEISEVTIEVVGQNVTQALQASNKPVTAKQDIALQAWAKKFDLIYDSQEAKHPRAA